MSKTAARLVILCALVGLGVSLEAAYVHYRLLMDPAYVSICDVNATVSCTQVYMSRFSTVGGVPVALFGATWFVVAGLLAAAGLRGPAEVRQNVPAYLFTLSTLALAAVLYFGYVSFFLLNAVCVLCVATYAAVIGTFLVSGAATAVPMTSVPGRALGDARRLVASPLALALVVLLAAGAGTSMAMFPREAALAASGAEGVAPPAPSAEEASEFERWFTAQPRIPLDIPAEGAAVVVVKFNDFQCPACGQSYQMYKSLFAKYEAEHPGQVRLVLKDFPLDFRCNNTMTQTVHPAACEAAVAVRLAAEHGRAEAMEDWFYTHQPSMTPDLVREQAAAVGEVQDFDARYDTTLNLVKRDIALARQLAVGATPTFFINGVKVEGALPLQYFDQAIRLELERASEP
jgi:uncharacterized membrane protein/predicted DsbA family dithiol-disulfide isomerase